MIKTLDDVREYRKYVPISDDIGEEKSNYKTAVWASEHYNSLETYETATFIADVYQLLKDTESRDERVEIWHFWLDATDLSDTKMSELKTTMGYALQEEE